MYSDISPKTIAFDIEKSETERRNKDEDECCKTLKFWCCVIVTCGCFAYLIIGIIIYHFYLNKIKGYGDKPRLNISDY